MLRASSSGDGKLIRTIERIKKEVATNESVEFFPILKKLNHMDRLTNKAILLDCGKTKNKRKGGILPHPLSINP